MPTVAEEQKQKTNTHQRRRQSHHSDHLYVVSFAHKKRIASERRSTGGPCVGPHKRVRPRCRCRRCRPSPSASSTCEHCGAPGRSRDCGAGLRAGHGGEQPANKHEEGVKHTHTYTGAAFSKHSCTWYLSLFQYIRFINI